MKFAWFLNVFLVINLSLNAQELEFKFQHFSVNDGLSQSTVYSIAQDSTGFIWLGTRDGLNRFDGREFSIYRPEEEISDLEERTIRAIEPGHTNQLWLGTDGGGVIRFNPQTRRFISICELINEKKCRADLNVLSLAVKGSDLVAGTREHGVILYDLNSGKQKNYFSGETVWSVAIGEEKIFAGLQSGLGQFSKQGDPSILHEDGAVYSLFYDELNAEIWAGTDERGVLLFDSESGELKDHDLLAQIDDQTIYDIQEDAQGRKWLGSRTSGIFVVDDSRAELSRITPNNTNPHSLPELAIRSLFLDRGDVMWVGTNTSGLSNYSPYRTIFPHYGASQNGMSDLGEVVLSFQEITDDQLLIGFEREGMTLFHKQTNSFTPVHFLDQTTIVCLFRDHENRVWVGSDGEGLFILDSNDVPDFKDPMKVEGLSNPSVLKLAQLSENEYLAGTYRGLNWIHDGRVIQKAYSRPGVTDSLQDDRILALFPEENGDFWVGTYSGGLSHYSHESQRFKTYMVSDSAGSISSNRVQSIHKDQEGRVWIGTYNGLNLFDEELKTFQVFNVKDGLPSAVVYGILEDDTGNLWLSTNKGLSRFNPETMNFTNYTIADGLQSNEFNGGAYFQNQEGSMFFGGVNGFNAFDPSSISKNEHRPNAAITNFQVEGELIDGVPTERNLKFNYQDSYFNINFVALDFSKPEKHQFRYRLEGLDEDWIQIGNNHSVNFSGLPAGRYTFTVQGSNGDDIWGVPSKPLNFSIAPPLWQTTWFRLSSLAVILFLLYGGYRYRTYYLLKEERTRNRIARDLHDDISATLSSISFFSEAAKRVTDQEQMHTHRFLKVINESAIEAKEKISDIIWAIDPSQDDWSTFLKKCKRFVADAFDSKEIDYKLEIAEDIPTPISLDLRQNLWLILKEAINNLVRYSEASEAEVRLVYQKKEATLCLEICDNGKGFDPDMENKGHGIENIMYRAEQINGEVSLVTKPGHGTYWQFEFEL